MGDLKLKNTEFSKFWTQEKRKSPWGDQKFWGDLEILGTQEPRKQDDTMMKEKSFPLSSQLFPFFAFLHRAFDGVPWSAVCASLSQRTAKKYIYMNIMK